MLITGAVLRILALAGAIGFCDASLCKRYEWKQMDLTGVDGEYSRDSMVPTGLSYITGSKIILSIPRSNVKNPCTLVYFNTTSNFRSATCSTETPSLACWPSYADNSIDSCDNIIYVIRSMRMDKFGRMWVFDSGGVGKGDAFQQICPPRIHIFNETTRVKLRMYEVPDAVLSPKDCNPPDLFVSMEIDSGFSEDDTFMYIANQKSILAYSWGTNSSWRFSHPYFSYDPIKGNFYYGAHNYHREYAGVFGLALSSANTNGFKTLYFHSLASTDEFSVSTSVLRNSSKTTDNYFDFTHVGDRGCYGHSGTQVASRATDVVFLNLVDWNRTACWNPKRPYTSANIHFIQDKGYFPSDIVVGSDGALCVLHTHMPKFLTGHPIVTDDYNFFIYSGDEIELIKGTPCHID